MQPICTGVYISIRKLPRFVLCFTVRFTVRFTAFHSAVRVSLHPTGVARISLSVCCELGWRGSNNVRKAYRGVECTPPAPPCGNVGQVPCFCDTEAFLAYSKPDHVSNFFFSSLAVNALWHGPDNDISSEKAVNSTIG